VRRPNHDELVRYCNDFYCLTEPEKFIYSHWVPNSDEQLLGSSSISRSEFIEQPYLRQAFFQNGFTPKDLSHNKCVIKVREAERSSVIVRIVIPLTVDRNLDFQLYKSRSNVEFNSYNGFPVDDYVLSEAKYDMKEMSTQFTISLPNIGKHKLEIGLRDNPNDAKSHFLSLCEYLIINEHPRHFEPHPRPDQGQRLYGMLSRSDSLHYSGDSAFVEANEGLARLTFEEIKLKINLNFRLQRRNSNSTSTAKMESDGKICKFRSKRQLVVLIKIPTHGDYIFEVVSEDKSAKPPLGRFLISSDRGCDDASPFPFPVIEGHNGAFGDTFDTDSVKEISSSEKQVSYVIPVSHLSAIFQWDHKEGESTELRIEMRIGREANFSAEMLYCSVTEIKPEPLHDYVHCEREQSKLIILVRFARHGNHIVSILVDGVVGPVYQYLIQVARVGRETVLPFPSIDKLAWKNDFQLYEPRSKLLVLGTEVKFKLRIARRANRVAVIVSSGRMELRCPTGDGFMWEGKVLIDAGNLVKVAAPLDGDSSDVTLLRYEVSFSFVQCR